MRLASPTQMPLIGLNFAGKLQGPNVGLDQPPGSLSSRKVTKNSNPLVASMLGNVLFERMHRKNQKLEDLMTKLQVDKLE